MKIGIDVIGVVLAIAVYFIAQLRFLSHRARYNLMGGCLAAYGLLRFAKPGSKLNLIFAGIALFFAIRFFVIAARSDRQ